MRRWIVLLVIVTTFMASNAWAWDSHGHHLADADPAHGLSIGDGDIPGSDEEDHGCHANAHVLALIAEDVSFSRFIRRAAFTADFANFASVETLPLIDPPIA